MRSIFDPKEEYLGDGATQTYSFDFKIETADQLLVIEVDNTGAEVQRVRGTDTTNFIRSITFDPVKGGGSITLLAVLTNTYSIILLLANDTPIQGFSFKNKGTFVLERIEAAFDYVMGALQRVAYLSQRSMRLSDFDDPTDFDPTLPPGMNTASAAGLIPNTKADGTGWASPSTWLGVPNIAAAIAAATAAATSATNAAGSATSASASATNAATSATNASTSATNAAGSATSAASSATAAAASATTAQNGATAAATSATNAAASAAAVAASVTTASTAATNAAASATAAAASATNAATSATAAAASAASVAAPNLQGTTWNAPYACVAGTTIPIAGGAYENKLYVKGSGGAVTMSANPQIQAGTKEGQKLTIFGTDDTNTVTLSDGTGLNIGDAWVAEAGRALNLNWDNDNALWRETSRS